MHYDEQSLDYLVLFFEALVVLLDGIVEMLLLLVLRGDGSVARPLAPGLLLSLIPLLHLQVLLELADFAVEDENLLLVSRGLLGQLLPRLLQLGELLDLYDHFPVQFLIVFLLDLGIALHILNDLLLLQILLAQALNQRRVYLWLGDLPFEQDAKPLRLLHIESKLRLILFDLRELEGLLQICKLLLFEHQLLVDLLDLELQRRYLTIFGSQCALLCQLCTRDGFELDACCPFGKEKSSLMA